MTIGGDKERSGEVRKYDFARPERLTTRLREKLSEDQKLLARAIARKLSHELVGKCDVEYRLAVEESTDVVLGNEFDPVFSFRLAPSRETAFLCFEAQSAQALIETLLGGSGNTRDVERPPTKIEIRLLGQIAAMVRDIVALHLNEKTAPTESPSYMDETATTGTGVRVGVSVSFDVMIGEGMGSIKIFYPYTELEEILELESDVAAQEGDAAGGKMTSEHVGAVCLSVKACTRPTQVQIQDIISLAVGDVLSLDRKMSDEVEIRIGDRLTFFGHPGTVENSVGVQVSRTR